MLTIKPQRNLRNAKEYFEEHLSAGDYYSAGRKVTGEWCGLGAEKLGLKGAVKEADFLRLCDGLHPSSGETLTLRKNGSRRDADGRQVANRRVFFDVCLAPPKSVSVVALLQDARILKVHEQAVQTAMGELEKFAEARVRKSGQRSERVTSKLVYAVFRHETSRELDPHLHSHSVVFNATFDPVEDRWKALEPEGIYRAQKFAQNCYFHEVAKGLRALGYDLDKDTCSFGIKGVPASVVDRFSKRHRQIDTEAQKRLEKGWRGNLKDLREQVAADVRKRKMKESTAERLRPLWHEQLTPAEQSALHSLRPAPKSESERTDVAALVAWADDHLFERRSVVNDYELFSAALARGRGANFNLAALRDAVEKRGYIRETGGRKLTSRAVLRTEWEIVQAARDGRGRHQALAAGYDPPSGSGLSAEQSAAVDGLLHSRDFITLFRGQAGTGKSRTLVEVERGLLAAGRPVVVLTPQRQQAQDLGKDGLPAQTVAQLLSTHAFPQRGVAILDEAGQVGGKDLHALIRLVQAHSGRLILSGDTRQHGAVAASDALRAIESHTHLKPAEIQEIRRQNPALGRSRAERAYIRAYRAAVKEAASGNIGHSFARLDGLGSVREIAPDKRRDALAAEYLSALSRKETVLALAQTWDEVRGVNEAIRERLKAAGKLGAGKTLTTYQAVDATEAEKRDPHFHEPGRLAHFVRGYGRFAKGELCEVVQANECGLVLMKNGHRSTMSYRYADRFAFVASSEMEVAPGDRLQLKFNGRSVEGAALSNGELVTVRRIAKDGALVVADDAGQRKTLSPSQRLFNRGLCVTSYASQGKTVDTVLFSDSANQAATSRNQWYVAISRGRKRVVVFTADKDALRANIERAGERELALDLKPTASVKRLPAWCRRAWVAIERVRRHRSVLAFTAQRHGQRPRPNPSIHL